jgi:hypothetical protein
MYLSRLGLNVIFFSDCRKDRVTICPLFPRYVLFLRLRMYVQEDFLCIEKSPGFQRAVFKQTKKVCG